MLKTISLNNIQAHANNQIDKRFEKEADKIYRGFLELPLKSPYTRAIHEKAS